MCVCVCVCVCMYVCVHVCVHEVLFSFLFHCDKFRSVLLVDFGSTDFESLWL